MLSAGSVHATLSGDFSPAGFVAFDRAMHKAKASMDDAEKKSGKLSKTMGVVGKVGAGIAAGGILAVGAALTKSVKLAADFEEQLSRLKATTHATSAEMAILKKGAMEAGAATKFSALDAAKAQVELAKGGLSVAEIASGGLKSALALAAAGELDLAEAAKTTVNAMKLFNIEGSQSMHVADSLSSAANNTTADVHDFAMALTQGGGAAKAAGLSFDDTIVALEAMAQAGVKGSDAGTSLKTALIQVTNPTNKQADAAKALGLAFYDANGNMKPLVGIAEMLKDKLGGLTREQRLQALQTIAGTDGFRTLLSLYEQGGKGVADLAAKTGRAGDAADTAAEKQDNLKGKIENLKGSLETAGIALGTGLLPGLTEGAEKATEAINKMAASGDLERLGEDIGDVISTLVEAGPAIAEGFHVALDGIGMAAKGAALVMMPLVTTIAGVLETVTALADAFNAVSGAVGGPKIDTGGLANAREDVEKLLGTLDRVVRGEGKKDVKINIKGDASQVTAALKRVQGMKMEDKTVKILARGDLTVAQKIHALENLGIGPKTAKILVENSQAIAGARSVAAALAMLQDKHIKIETERIERVRRVGSPSPGADTGRRAAGRGPGGFERALVGEGSGGELVGNPTDGWTWVDRATLMDLAPSDAVIPEDPRYAGRALGLMFGMLGVPGYAKGKAPKKPLTIPAAVQFGAVPEDELDKRRDDAREAYQKRKESVRDLDVDIRAQRRDVAEARGSKAKARENRQLRLLQDKRNRLNDGGDGLTSLAGMRSRWQALQKQATVLAQVNDEIERLNTVQETDRTRMATASKRGDAGAYGAAKTRRTATLATLRAKYSRALGLAKPGSRFAAELAGKLAGIEGEIADVEGDAFAAVSPFEGGMLASEKASLDQLQMAQALAGLTPDLADDQATARATQGFLEGLLGAAMRDPARGGPSVIRDLAEQVKQARDNVASFAPGAVAAGNDNADVVAQLAQRDEQLRVSQRNEQIAAQSLGVFRGFTQNNYMMHPGSPEVMRDLADATVGGIGLQPSVTSPRSATGL